MAMTAYQKAMANKLQAGDIDPDKLKQAGISQMGSQMSNANSAVAQAAASAVKGGAVNPATARANTAKAMAQANTPEQAYLASYTGGAVNPDTPPLDKIQPGASATPAGNNHYFAFGRPDAGFQNGMSAEDQASWNAIGKKFAAGDTSWNKDTNPFREDGKWGSFTDANGNVNGWLYAANGTGGYAPVFGGKVGESGYKSGTVFYGPDGTSYMMGPDGTLSKNGTVEWLKYGQSIGPQTGYHNNGGSFIGKDADGNLRYYDYDTVSEADLERMGYYRDKGGMINLINNDYYIAKGIRNGQITPYQAALANDWNEKMKSPGGSTWVRDNVWGVTPDGNVYPSGGNGGSYPSGGGNGGGGYPSGGDSYPSGSGGAPTTSFQDYLDQWDYGPPPEWNGTEYETKRDEAVQNAQNMKWNGSDYQQKRDELVESAMNPYEGSPYDAMRDEALQRYGEEWGGSEYRKKRDEALQNAENMKFNYNPETDPVWQALQKQYRREGDRATRQTMGQAAAMTGGVPSSYAATAAAMAGNNYAAQLSDRLPQVYQDAYNRYLQEFQRQMGISDQYAGFDDREYSRWADQQGKNLDLADRYNQYGQQDYGQYMDRVNQQLSGADRYNGYDQTEYQRYLDQYGQQLDAADRYNQYGSTEYGRYRDQLDQYNTDKNFEYGRLRDARRDYENDRDFNEDVRRFGMNYALQAQAQDFDQWYKQQGLSMDQAQMEFDQWYKQQGLSMEYEQMVFDQWYKGQVLGQNQQEIDNDYAYKQGVLGQNQQEIDNDYAYKQGVLGQNQQEIDFDQSYKTTAYQDELARKDREDQKEQAMVQAQFGNYAPLAELYGVTEEAIKNWLGVGDVTDTGSAPSGGGYSGGSAASGNGAKRATAETHDNGQPKSTAYDQAWADVQSYANNPSFSKTMVLNYIKSLITRNIISDEEANMMLLKLGYDKGSGGGGSYAPVSPNNVNMTK